jgi:hypothetical protein
MGYLICEKCNVSQEVEEDFDIGSFDICEDCGSKLNLYDTFDDYYNEYSVINRESIVRRKGYSEKKSFKYNIIVIVGVILGLIGLIGLLTSFISLSLIGAILALYGYGSGLSWNKGIKGEKIVKEYLKKELTTDYIIFNDIKYPGSKGNLDHVVVGPNGVFLIETKNLSDFFLIDNKEWLYKKHSSFTIPFKRSFSQPGKQVLTNVKDLNKFLDSYSVNLNDLWINPIVTLISNNYKIKTKPKHYDIVNLTSIPEFIMNRKKQFNPKILNEIALIIEPYCNVIEFGQSQIIENHNKSYDNSNTFDLKDENIKSENNSLIEQYNNSKFSNNKLEVESTVIGYLKQLPKEYLIFTNVKIPRNKEILGHTVIGPNGIFVIKNKIMKVSI